MSDLPKCRLCGSDAATHKVFGGIKYCCSSETCTMHDVLMLKSQWRTLMTQQQPDQDRLRFKSACEISGEKHPEYVRGYEAAMDAVCNSQKAGEPLFWVRVHPNGEPSRDILHNDVIEELRKKSGAWKPLFLCTAPQAQERKCWCHTCRPVTLDDMRMVLCPDCGNKRCPKANDHRNSCTESNEPGQIGSAYPAPQAQPAPTQTDWRPIETAPEVKGDYFWCFIAWGPDGDQSTGTGFRWRGKWFAAGCFYRGGSDRQFEWQEIEVKPTHWHPLPPALGGSDD